MVSVLKRAAGLILAAALAVSLFSAALAANDAENHWAGESITRWTEAGVLESDTDTDGSELYRPDDALTRGELAKALNQIFGWTEMAENKFYDLTYAEDGVTYLSDVELYQAVLKANAAGVLLGTDDFNVLPYAEITRQDACVMLCRAFEIEESASAISFTDAVEIADYAEGAVSALCAAGYISGFEDGSFRPNSSITRAEICAIFDKLEADYKVLAARAEKGDIVNNWTDITVTTVDTYDSGWIETDSEGNITTEATGTKDLVIRLWYPDNVEEGAEVPVLLYTFGGAWISGDRTKINSYLVETMLNNGIAVASLTYRWEQEAIFPYSMYDLQAQIRYLRINASELGLDADSFGITGVSAGGYWATQMAVTGNEADLQDPGYVTFDGDDRSVSTELQYCGWQYGCANMLTCFEDVDYRIHSYWDNWSYHDKPTGCDPALFGTDDIEGYSYVNEATGEVFDGVSTSLLREIWRSGDTEHELWWLVERFIDGSPIFHVDADDPSFFFYHGTNDPLCPVQQAFDMYAALIEAGVEGNELRLCEGMGHGAYTHPQYYTELLDWLAEQAWANAN